MNIRIRPYQEKDKSAVLDLLRKSTPMYFHPAEESDLVQYLNEEVEDYFVALSGEQIIGSGGVNYFPAEIKARISWDIIDTDFQGKGIGRLLVEHRLAVIQRRADINTVEVRTSQIAHGFYYKMGFSLGSVEKDYWAKGFDLYRMRYSLFGK
ncbi:GNAT family N-acetyltransferase [Cryomorphaceae bacterium 1068]|nr:GNAT family N-acetyltransferase [Cryomorphaceae bacterium 1068]